MARIRSIKPEFWDSPSVANASPWARLLFIAMWNWADDYGRGTANLKELEGFAFPNDDAFWDSSGNTVHFRDLVAEVSECFDVVFYEVDKRQFYSIPTWDTHQRNERRAKQSKHPAPPVVEPNLEGVAEIPCNDTEVPNSSGPGTGEQGNRGTGEQKGGAGAQPSAPSIYCQRHPKGTDRACRGCKIAYAEYEKWVADDGPVVHTHRWLSDGTCISCVALREFTDG